MDGVDCVAEPNYKYSVFGLTISSPIACEELVTSDDSPDATVCYGQNVKSLDKPIKEGAAYQASPGELILNIDGVASFYVANGSDIIIDRHEGCDNDSLRVFLLGSAFGALLQQRGYIPFHASVIETSDGAVIFLGCSGIGKSTLAAAFSQKGYRVISDDICAVKIDDDGVARVYPAYPQLKLWPDSLEHLNINKDDLAKIRPNLDKRRVKTEQFSLEPIKLSRVYALDIGNDIKQVEMKALKGSEAFDTLKKNVYRKQYAVGFGLKVKYFEYFQTILKQVTFNTIYRPASIDSLSEMMALIEPEGIDG